MKNHREQPYGTQGRMDVPNRATFASYEFGADRFSYIALAAAPFAAFMFFSYFAAFGEDKRSGQVWVIATLAGTILVAVIAYLRTFRVIIRDGTLIYRRLFHRASSISLCDIEEAKVDVKLFATPRGRPPYALLIKPLSRSDTAPFAINMKFLSRGDLRTLLDLLGEKVADKKRWADRIVKKRK
jgi:hypothetical protein